MVYTLLKQQLLRNGGLHSILYSLPQRLLDPVNSHQSIGEEDMAKAAGKFNVRYRQARRLISTDYCTLPLFLYTDAAECATVDLLRAVRASLSARGVENLIPPLRLG